MKKKKPIKPRTQLRSPSDKWIIPTHLDTKKQRRKSKAELEYEQSVLEEIDREYQNNRPQDETP